MKQQVKYAFTPIQAAYVGIFAALIAVCSWVSIPTTVPFTLQTFAVFFVLGVAGGKIGFFSVLTYLLLGALGVPVFSGFKGGIGALLGNTGGYLLGFLLLAAVYWLLTALLGEKRAVKTASLILGILLCYVFGTAWFVLLYTKANGGVALLSVLGWCVFPFLLPDAVKLTLALLLSQKLGKYIKK